MKWAWVYLYIMEHQIIRTLVLMDLLEKHKNDDFRINWIDQ